MKFLLIIVVLLTTLFAENKKEKITLGAGAYLQTQPYLGVKSIKVPSPVIFFDNSLFYIRWSRAGMYFLGTKEEDYSWGVSLTLEPRPFGYKPSDSSALKDLHERETTFEGGIALSASFGEKYIEVMLLTDLLSRHDSWLLKAEVGNSYKIKSLTLYPSFIISYQSHQFMNYYYGITQQEALKSSYNYYNAKSGLGLGVQTYIKYPLTQQLSTLINLRADRLPNSAQDSPIVNQKSIYSGLLSLIYTFEY